MINQTCHHVAVNVKNIIIVTENVKYISDWNQGHKQTCKQLMKKKKKNKKKSKQNSNKKKNSKSKSKAKRCNYKQCQYGKNEQHCHECDKAMSNMCKGMNM